MADNNIKQNQGNDRNQPNQTMQHEQAKGSVSGQGSQSEQGQFDKNRQEKGVIGGGQPQGQSKGENKSQTGEPGRARSELDEKNRSETTSR